jgi:hypothetical protein
MPSGTIGSQNSRARCTMAVCSLSRNFQSVAQVPHACTLFACSINHETPVNSNDFQHLLFALERRFKNSPVASRGARIAARIVESQPRGDDAHA